MDEIDKKIITLLQQNARTPLKTLAEHVFLSSPAVSARVHWRPAKMVKLLSPAARSPATPRTMFMMSTIRFQRAWTACIPWA